MYCVHGFPENSCPHCRQQMRIKPRINLVDLAPRDLPNPTPLKDKLNEPKTLQHIDLHSNNHILPYMPQRLTRNFDLTLHRFGNSPSIFEDRLNELNVKNGIANNIDNLNQKMKIVDVRKKFTTFDE